MFFAKHISKVCKYFFQLQTLMERPRGFCR